MGDGVNVAARLEAICEPGGICLSDDAYRQVRDKVEVSFADLGDKALKNIARPARVFGLAAAAISALRGSAIPSAQRMPDEATLAVPEKGPAARRRLTPVMLVGAAAFLLAVGTVGLWTWRGDKPIAGGVGGPLGAPLLGPETA